MAKVWAGIGSRETPKVVQDKMTKIAQYLGEKDYWCRTGAARGADQAFGVGRADRTILYLPWNGYEKDWVHSRIALKTQIGCLYPSDRAIDLASQHHPKWDDCSLGARKLHGRNSHIILGRDLESPCEFVIYWARTDGNGNPLGGTGEGIRIARAFKVPTYNLNNNMETKALATFIDIGEL